MSLLPAAAEIALGLALLALVVGVSLAVILLGRRPVPALSEAAAAARHHAQTVHVIAWVTGFLVGPVLVAAPIGWAVSAAGAGPYGGIGAAVYPAALGLLFLAVHAIGELTWPRPSGTVRRAALMRRTVRDVAPRRLVAATVAWAGTLVVTAVACGVVAEDGRQVTRVLPDGSAGAGPFPGWFFGIPLLVAAALVLAATYGVLRLVAGRAAVVDAAPEWDLGLRRLSGHRAMRGAQLVLGLTAGAVLLVAGTALQNVGRAGIEDVPPGSPLHTVTGIVLVLVGLGVVLTAAVLTVLPAPVPLDPAAAGARTADPAGRVTP